MHFSHDSDYICTENHTVPRKIHTPKPYPQSIPYGFVCRGPQTIRYGSVSGKQPCHKLNQRAASLLKHSQLFGPPAVRFCDALEISPGGTPKSTGVGSITKPIPKPYPIRLRLVDMGPRLAHRCVGWAPGMSRWHGLPG